MDGKHECVLAVLAIQQIPNCLTPLFVRLCLCLPLFGAQLPLVVLRLRIGCAALRTPVRKSRFIRLQLKFFAANNAGFDRKTHPNYFIEIRVFSVPPSADPATSNQYDIRCSCGGSQGLHLQYEDF